MATYAIGDLQGCADALDRLLEKIGFDPAADELWFTGDLVNRGPDSLRTLRRVRDLGARAHTVLGNHDFHLLAQALGVRAPGRTDTLDEILKAPDRDALVDWLRHRPLARSARVAGEDFLLVHAGVLPEWSAGDALARAAEVEAALAADDWAELIGAMYADEPSRWDAALTGMARLRFIINAFTRLRLVSAAGALDLQTKEGPADSAPGLSAWFDVPGRRAHDTTIVFGHWSTLGLWQREHLLGLDTGCVWGGALTAVRLDNRALTQVACPQYRVPG